MKILDNHATFLRLILTIAVLGYSAGGLAGSAAEEAWNNLAGKNAKRPAFAYVQNDPALPNVLIYGDSISIHYTPDVREHLVGKANLYRLYRNGSDSSGFVKFMSAMHETMRKPELDMPWSFEWDVIHFNVGLHDLKYVANRKLDKKNGTLVSSISEYKKNLNEIIAYLKQLAPNAKLIFALTTPVPEGAEGRFAGDAKKYNVAALEVLSAHKDIVINDLYTPTKAKHSLWWINSNDVHYNKVGIAAQAEIVSGVIESALSEKTRKNKAASARSSSTKKSTSDSIDILVDSTSAIELTLAIEQAKPHLASGKDVNIKLSAGTYYLSNTLELANDSESTLSLVGAPTGQTVISGATKLSPKWQAHTQHILKATLDLQSVDQLYVGSEAQVRARYPNFDADAGTFNGYAADAIAPKRTQHWKNPEGAYVHALHKGRWGGMHYKIVGKSKDGEWKLEGGYQNNRPSPLHKKYRYVENVFEELDAPNEWYFDSTTQTLYFYPENIIKAKSATIEIPQLKHLIEIVGVEGKPAKNISISGISFTHTQHTFMETREPLLRSDWAIYRGAALTLEQAENIEIKNSNLYELGGNAVAINGYARNIKILGNHIYRIGAGAINFVGDPSAVRSPSFTYNEFVKIEDLDLESGPKNNLYPSDSLVHDNLIHNIGLVEKQVAGVQLSMSKSIIISHNSIYQVPRAGINASEGTWGGHLIEYNDVFDTVLETGDHGAFNSWGRDRFWHPNRGQMEKVIRKYPDLYLKDAMETVVIRNNRFRCDHGWDIDLDDGSSNYDIYNNVMLNGGLKLREGFRRNAYNNILINNSLHPHVWFENSKDTFFRNISMVRHTPVSSYHWGDKIDHNFYVTEAELKAVQALGLDKHSVFGAPEFVDPSSGDYRVKPVSKALGVGFVNFPMDQFGVKSERLKAIALTPTIPELILASGENEKSKVYELLGAKIKTVETLGEQSALGIAEMAGAMVLSVEKGSRMAKAGIQLNDVFLKVQGKDEIATAEDLLRGYQSNKWRKKLRITISRNQNLQDVNVVLRD